MFRPVRKVAAPRVKLLSTIARLIGIERICIMSVPDFVLLENFQHRSLEHHLTSLALTLAYCIIRNYSRNISSLLNVLL